MANEVKECNPNSLIVAYHTDSIKFCTDRFNNSYLTKETDKYK